MSRGSIYLIGPIGGLSYDDATGWRIEARKVLEEQGWEVLDPMTGKECLKDDKNIGTGLNNAIFVENGHIFHSDVHRLNKADIYLANFLRVSQKPSIGTFFEMGYGYAKAKTIMTVATDEYMVKHPFIHYSSIIAAKMEDAYALLDKMGR